MQDEESLEKRKYSLYRCPKTLSRGLSLGAGCHPQCSAQAWGMQTEKWQQLGKRREKGAEQGDSRERCPRDHGGTRDMPGPSGVTTQSPSR